MLYNDDKELEQSPVVANCCMNRERDLCGTNGYDVEVGFHPLKFLDDKVANNGKARWLDLCCGTGKALVQTATIIERDGLSIEIVGVDLVGMFMPHSSNQLTLIEASLSTWNPAGTFDLITCIHGLHYIGDKLGMIARACSWLNHDGLFVANLDTGNLRLNPSGSPSRVLAKELRQVGVEYLPSKRLIRCVGYLCRLPILEPTTKPVPEAADCEGCQAVPTQSRFRQDRDASNPALGPNPLASPRSSPSTFNRYKLLCRDCATTLVKCGELCIYLSYSPDPFS